MYSRQAPYSQTLRAPPLLQGPLEGPQPPLFQHAPPLRHGGAAGNTSVMESSSSETTGDYGVGLNVRKLTTSLSVNRIKDQYRSPYLNPPTTQQASQLGASQSTNNTPAAPLQQSVGAVAIVLSKHVQWLIAIRAATDKGIGSIEDSYNAVKLLSLPNEGLTTTQLEELLCRCDSCGKYFTKAAFFKIHQKKCPAMNL